MLLVLALATSIIVFACWKKDSDQIIVNKKIDISKFHSDYTNNQALEISTKDENAVTRYLIDVAKDVPTELKTLLENKKLLVIFLHKQKHEVGTEFIQNLKLTTVFDEADYKGTLNIKIKVNPKIRQIYEIPDTDGVSLGLILFDSNNNWYSFSDEGNIFFGKKNIGEPKVLANTNSQITAATIDQSNNIYVGDEDGNIYFLKKDGKMIRINTSPFDGAIKNLITKNNVWYAITEKSFYFGASNTLLGTILTFDDSEETCKNLFVDSNGFWYVGTSNGKIYYGQKNNAKKTLFSGDGEIVSFAIDRNNNWYAGTDLGKFYYGVAKKEGVVIQQFEAEVLQIVFDNNNNWYAILENSIYFGEQSKEGTLIADSDDSFNSVIVADNHLMISTSDGGVYFNKSQMMTKMFIVDASSFSKLVYDLENNLYVITNMGKIYFIGY